MTEKLELAQGLFTPEEYLVRIETVQEQLAATGFDGILVADPANMFYLTGYNAWSFYTPQILYVPVVGSPLLMLRQMDAVGAHHTAVISGDTALGYPENMVHRQDAHPGTWMARQLREYGYADGTQKRVAVESDSHFFSVRTFLSLTAELPEWELADSGELVNWVRVVKSPAEIELMRHAGRVATRVMDTAIGLIREGRPVNEIAGEVMREQAYDDGDYPAIVPMFPRGVGSDTPHLTWTSEPVGSHEPVLVELAGVHHRYHTPLARTVSVGTPSRELDRIAKVTLEALHTALELLVPGNTPAQVSEAWNAVLARYGMDKPSRLGYSIGVGYPPDWGERTISLRSEDRTVFRENMTFHVIAGMWLPGSGFETSESVRVAEGGPEMLSAVPRGLAVVEP